MLTITKKKLLLPAFLTLVAISYLATDRRVVTNQSPEYINHSVGHKERINRVNHLCTHTDFASQEKSDNFSIGLIYADKYKLAYISIPKVGSTFLKKFFYVLKFGSKNAHKIFDRMRIEVHAMTGELVTRFNRRDLDHVITLITARNPYTRLYSAYIDKVYLPLSISLGKSIIHENFMTKLSRSEGNSSLINAAVIRSKVTALVKQLVCTKDITFQAFLDFALTKPLRGKAMYDHYCPISLLLSNSICKLKNFLIVKQETFADDIEYVSKLIKVDDDIYELFHDHFHKDHVESTVSSIVETIYRHVRMQSEIGKNPDCWTMDLIAERLWKSFQIQGVIDENSEFPKFIFSSKKSFFDSGYLIKVILNEVQGNRLSQSQSEAQRKRALFKAYRNISDVTTRRIRDVYDIDFQMFGYETGSFGIQK